MVLGVLMTLVICPPATAQEDTPVIIHEGFQLNGNMWREWPEAQRSAYVIGLYDGVLFAPAFDLHRRNDEVSTWFERCDPVETSEQLLAIVDKYVEGHPTDWSKPFVTLFFGAMKEACAR